MSSRFRILAVILILIGLPLFAWYFLDAGTRMRKEAMESLKPKDVIQHFQNTTYDESIITDDSLKGSRWLIALIAADSQTVNHADAVLRLRKQSSEEFSLKTLAIVGQNFGETSEFLNSKLNWPVGANDFRICYMSSSHIFPFGDSVFNIPDEFKNQSLVILVDDKLQIRNYYKLSDAHDVKLLVRHLPVFLSQKK